MLTSKLKPWEIYGGKKAFFIRYADLVKKTITDLKLKAIDPAVIGSVSAVQLKANAANMNYFDPEIFGGRRFAHIHHLGGIYRLDAKQWGTFVSKVKEDMIQRIQNANNISLENVIEISDALDPIS
jgi:hypothetical protein